MAFTSLPDLTGSPVTRSWATGPVPRVFTDAQAAKFNFKKNLPATLSDIQLQFPCDSIWSNLFRKASLSTTLMESHRAGTLTPPEVSYP